MPTVKVNGIVLRRADYGEGNRMVTLLTPDGPLSFAAPGCKKAASRRLIATELFSAGEFILDQKGERVSLQSFEPTERFYPLREEYQKLTHGVYWLNLCEAAAQPGDNCERLYKMLLLSLAVLTYQNLPLLPLTSVFLIQFSILQGYAPELDTCPVCGKAVAAPMRFETEAGGVCCTSCVTRGQWLTMDDLLWLREAKAKGAFVLAGRRGLPAESDGTSLPSIFQILRKHVECRLEKEIRSGRLL